MTQKFYKTTITYVVLSEQPLPSCIDLSEIASMTYDGDCVGEFGESKEEVLSPKEMADALYKAGSEPGFFMLDDEGNDQTEMPETYAIHELDENGESTGWVHFYCCEEHAKEAIQDSAELHRAKDYTKPTKESEYPQGTVCENCGIELPDR